MAARWSLSSMNQVTKYSDVIYSVVPVVQQKQGPVIHVFIELLVMKCLNDTI